MTDGIDVPVRRLGPGAPVVSVFGLGSWNIWDRMNFDDVVALIRSAVDAGVTLFDVAHYNMGPHAENARTDLIFGEAVRAACVPREDYQLCGKLWLWDYPRTGFAGQLETSLGRIGVDRADTVVVGDYLTRPDLRQVVLDVNEQIRAGRFGSWGVNNWPCADLDVVLSFAAHEGLVGPSFAQLKYSIVRRTMAEGSRYDGHFAAGRLGLQASDVLEGGILAGRLYPDRKIGADPGGIREQIRSAAGIVAQVAAEFDATAAQVAIAFCLANPHVTNVLFGASSQAQLDANLGALTLWRESGQELRSVLAGLWLDSEGAENPREAASPEVPAVPPAPSARSQP